MGVLTRLLRIILFFLPLLLLSCPKKALPPETAGPSAAELAQVSVIPARYIHYREQFPLFGTAYARREYRIVPEEAGKVEEIFVKEGDPVKRGDPVIRMEERKLLELLETARLQYRIAEQEVLLANIALDEEVVLVQSAVALLEKRSLNIHLLEREKEDLEETVKESNGLFHAGAISMEELKKEQKALDTLGSQLQALRIDADIAASSLPDTRQEEALVELKLLERERIELGIRNLKRRVAGCVISAPGEGVVSAIFASPGDILAGGERVMSIFDSGSVRIEIPVPNRYFSRISPGGTILFPGMFTSRFPGNREPVKGEVGAIIPRSDEQGRFILLGQGIRETGLPLLPGSRHEVLVESNKGIHGIELEPGMILEKEGAKRFLLLVEEDRLRYREIQTVEGENGYIWITGGIREGELICTSLPPQFHLGMRVKAIEGGNLEKTQQ